MAILVTGGAGYIGSHFLKLLRTGDDPVVVVDDLSSGQASRLDGEALVEMDLSADGAQSVLEDVMRTNDVRAVVHFAAQKRVDVSMARPIYYYRQNVGGMTNLLGAMESTGVESLVFSSSAAVYGDLDVDLVTEATDCSPANPYGETKLINEWMIERACASTPLTAVSLRYFNVAGAGSTALGDLHAFNLVPIVLDRLAHGKRPIVFGDDYLTADGSCVRDYIHVSDLAAAHVAALSRTSTGHGRHEVFNVGTGSGSSVLEVIEEASRVTGILAAPQIVERRPGDPATVVADVRRARAVLGWTATQSLADIVQSAWAARQSAESGAGDAGARK